MKMLNVSRIVIAQSFWAVSLLFFQATDSMGQIAAGDLTVTVEEQENGDVKFSLSGTAYMLQSASIYTTNHDASTPPSSRSPGGVNLPPGLKLTVPDRSVPICEQQSAEEAVGEMDLLIDTVVFDQSTAWYLGYFTSGLLMADDPITGSGTVTTDTIPFYWFVPGTYVITPNGMNEPEPSESEVAEGGVHVNDPYSITYKVIPFAANPDLTISEPSRFPKTRVRRSGGSQVLTVRNRGNVTIRNLSVALTGRDTNDFSHGSLPVGELAPGESTRVTVGFKPLRKGLRTASLVVKGLYQPPMPVPTAEPEEGELPVPDPVAVSATVKLEGLGVSPRRKPRPTPPTHQQTPRDPYNHGVDE